MSINSKLYAVLYEKQLSETLKIVAHVISFGNKKPVLAIQHMWREGSSAEWKFGKMAVLTSEFIQKLIELDVFNKALSIINETNN